MLVGIASLAGCSSSSPASNDTAPRAAVSLGPGGFRVADSGTTDRGASRYVATSDSSPGCTFEIVIEKSASTAGPFSTAAATLTRRPAADCTAFLRAVAKELEFTGELPTPATRPSIVGSVVVLATDQSRSPERGGGFSSTPRGRWTAMKLFLADGDAEVYLNLNVREGAGEFVPKDAEYARAVVTELAKILLPEAR